MAISRGPKLVTNGLVLALDASDDNSFAAQNLPIKNGLLLWLDAADDDSFSYSSGTVVSQWRDKSGNNFHANQSTTAQQPSRNTFNNSRKSVFFNAASRLDYMTISSGIALPNDASIFIVYKPSTQIYEYAVLIDNYHGQGGNYGFVIQRVSTNAQFYYANAGDGTGFIDTSASPWTYTDNVIQLLSLNKASSTGTPYISGTAQTSRSVRAATAQYTTGLAIGSLGAGGGRFYNGDMCEILIFNRSLSSTEMKQVHTYLGQKWGILNTDKSIVDASGGAYVGLLGNGTTSAMPLFDVYNKGALKFDGSNDYIATGVSSIVPTSTASYTVSVWCYRNTNNTGLKELLAQWTNANSGNSFFFGFDNSAVRFTDNWNPITVAGAGNTNVWMNLVGVYTVSNAYIYLNGSLAATKGSGFTYTGTGPLIIGRQGELNAEYFDGNISNVLIYNRALSATEVSQNYNAQKSRFTNTIVQQGLVLNLDAGNNYSYAGSGVTWYDVSGNGKIGTLTGGVTYSSLYGGDFILDGVNGYIQTDLNQNTDNAQITWEAWFWDNSPGGFAGNTAIISNYGAVATTPYTSLHVLDTGNIFFGQRNSSGTADDAVYGTSICNGVWHHLVGVVDSSNMLLYVDGVVRASKTKITGTTTSGQNLVIGGNHLGRYQSCRIASARCYNIALSAAQVLQNYNATKGRFGL